MAPSFLFLHWRLPLAFFLFSFRQATRGYFSMGPFLPSFVGERASFSFSVDVGTSFMLQFPSVYFSALLSRIFDHAFPMDPSLFDGLTGLFLACFSL